MLRLAVVLLFAGAIASATSFRAPCDMKGSEKKAWCGTCVAYIPRAEVKASTCPKDKARVETLDVCVKNIYVAKCHPTTSALKPLTCCGVLYDKPNEDLAKIYWLCSTCKEKGSNRDLKHLDSCADRKVVKTCEKSGTAPHSTVGK